MRTTKVHLMTSIISRERRVMKIATRDVDFPTIDLKEQEKTISHIDLVVSQLPTEIWYELQSRMTEEI
jgi:hypothetical protein